ncbi:unnamed protein product [Brachionus calyciflorus]|uniref:Uncharacterized protein n=1 Tax=Brachionus calyciflorus TaxID=104777 RepID=A0A814AG32_9BILA|nr:unnamed protein product [Brachionus calyciflorus]
MRKVSITFCAAANGKKLLALILVPRKTPLPDFIPPPNVILVYESSATFDLISIRDQFFKRVLFPYLDTNGFEESSLIWDSTPCHQKELVKISAIMSRRE